MKYLFLCFISFPALAAHFVGDIKSYGIKGEDVIVTLKKNGQVLRLKSGESQVPCLRDAWVSRERVEVDLNQEGKVLGCKLAAKKLPGASTEL